MPRYAQGWYAYGARTVVPFPGQAALRLRFLTARRRPVRRAPSAARLRHSTAALSSSTECRIELQRAIECRSRALLGTHSPRVNAERHRSCLAPQVAHGTQEAVPRVQHGYGTLWLRVNTGSCPEYGTAAALYGGATSQRRAAPELPRAERPAVRHVGEGLVALLRVIGVWQHVGSMPRVEALGRRPEDACARIPDQERRFAELLKGCRGAH